LGVSLRVIVEALVKFSQFRRILTKIRVYS